MFIRLRTARPGTAASKLADLAVWIAFLSGAIAVLLARLPTRWVALAGDRPWAVRAAMLLLLMWLFMWIGNLVQALLARAPYLLGRTLTLRERGRSVRLPVREIAAIHVEARPPGSRDTFVVEMKDGTTHDLCPVHWRGAGRMYARMVRALRLGR